MTRISQKVSFPGSNGDMLAGRLEIPDQPVAFALFAHCFSCSKDILAASRIADALSSRGIAVLRFDFTGLGASEGDFSNTNYSSNVDDIVAAAEFLEAEYEAPKLLIGHSLGGSAVLMAVSRIPACRAVSTIGAPADPAHVTQNFKDHITEIQQEGKAEVELGGRKFTIKKQFLDDLRDQPATRTIGNLKKALLVLHAPLDEYVGIDNATDIFIAARHPKSFISLDDADHLLTRKEDAAWAGAIIASWAARYVGSAPGKKDTGSADSGHVIVRESGRGKYANEVLVGKHRLAADEPESVGGSDTGPTPYDYLSAALGACTSMTLRMYADRKKWPLEGVKVTLKHEKKHAEDCAECEGQVDHIDRIIRIDGPLDAEQRARLLEIADKCPVHKTLNSPVIITTAIED